MRLEAVARALYDADSTYVDQAHALNGQLDALNNSLKVNNGKIADLGTQIDRARTIVDAMPSKDQLEKLAADDKDLDAKRNDAEHKLKDCAGRAG